jgi:hypothetical protein
MVIGLRWGAGLRCMVSRLAGATVYGKIDLKWFCYFYRF